jgi:mannose-1-phosphate guanylyltransferase/mannose-6-phosphate isomerase
MSIKILPVILSGGFGTRLWPLSRKHNPKQFLKTDTETSLFNKALNLVNTEEFLKPLIVSNEAHKFFILDETTDFSALILESVGKNTAASIALASIKAKEMYGEDVILLVMPSDHLISDKTLFLKSIQEGLELAKINITLFGIKPTFPATGYGYIETDGTNVKRFREKPNKETAEEFLSLGNFAWNSGIFMFSVNNILNSFKEFAPKILEISEISLKTAHLQNNISTLPKDEFEKCEDISFDYAILEKSNNISCVEMLSPWTDVGDLISYTENFTSSPRTEMIDTRNTHIISEKLVATIGLEGITIIDTKDALLVAKNENLQDVKKIVKSLEEKNAEEVLFSSKVYRPWGFYEILLEMPNYKVKRIFLKPACKLSLQSHNKRAEHWVVVEGVATVIVNDNEFTLKNGESVKIPLEAKHRLANKTENPVVIIETQIGEYLGEDDIIRYDDLYNRK